jgi:hypothetical protein
MQVKQRKKEEVSFFNQHEFLLSLFLFLIFLAFIILFSKSLTNKELPMCGDGTPYDSCSNVKPYYCFGGKLIEKASVCGCNRRVDGDSCISDLQAEPKNMTLKYILDGERKTINFTVYKGLADYLSGISRAISYENGEKPNRTEFRFKKINEQEQRKLLLPLVIKIQNLTNDKLEQARIAISIVQNIPYGFSNKTDNFFGKSLNYSRYPYEVLYDSQGVCGEKSELLAFLLREIGYETVIFYQQKENHELVGIKCPSGESYKGTGYCFIETTGPSIISDDSIEYVGGVVLNSDPEVILISDGKSFGSGLQEYKDANELKSLKNNIFVLFRQSRFERLKQKYGLVEEYNIA